MEKLSLLMFESCRWFTLVWWICVSGGGLFIIPFSPRRGGLVVGWPIWPTAPAVPTPISFVWGCACCARIPVKCCVILAPNIWPVCSSLAESKETWLRNGIAIDARPPPREPLLLLELLLLLPTLPPNDDALVLRGCVAVDMVVVAVIVVTPVPLSDTDCDEDEADDADDV